MQDIYLTRALTRTRANHLNEDQINFNKMESHSKETSRIEAFSDGVFAIAITLLILDIHVPAVTANDSLFHLLLKDWVTYLAFLIGFFTILVCWINHHYMYLYICRNNDMLLLLNGFKLLVVSFTPFATALLSRYIGTPQQQTAIGIYTFNFFLMGLSMFFLWRYACGHGLISAESTGILRTSTRFYFFAPVLSGIIFILSFFNIWICLSLFALMFLIFVFPRNAVARLERSKVLMA